MNPGDKLYVIDKAWAKGEIVLQVVTIKRVTAKYVWVDKAVSGFGYRSRLNKSEALAAVTPSEAKDAYIARCVKVAERLTVALEAANREMEAVRLFNPTELK